MFSLLCEKTSHEKDVCGTYASVYVMDFLSFFLLFRHVHNKQFLTRQPWTITHNGIYHHQHTSPSPLFLIKCHVHCLVFSKKRERKRIQDISKLSEDPWDKMAPSVLVILNPSSCRKYVICVDDRPFGGCTTIRTIEFPPSLEVIGADTFAKCTALQAITLPATSRRIKPGAFDGCVSLTSSQIRWYGQEEEKRIIGNKTTSIWNQYIIISITIFCDANRGGRPFVSNTSFDKPYPSSLWPIILHRLVQQNIVHSIIDDIDDNNTNDDDKPSSVPDYYYHSDKKISDEAHQKDPTSTSLQCHVSSANSICAFFGSSWSCVIKERHK